MTEQTSVCRRREHFNAQVCLDPVHGSLPISNSATPYSKCSQSWPTTQHQHPPPISWAWLQSCSSDEATEVCYRQIRPSEGDFGATQPELRVDLFSSSLFATSQRRFGFDKSLPGADDDKTEACCRGCRRTNRSKCGTFLTAMLCAAASPLCSPKLSLLLFLIMTSLITG